jgi:hypothetical protein
LKGLHAAESNERILKLPLERTRLSTCVCNAHIAQPISSDFLAIPRLRINQIGKPS